RTVSLTRSHRIILVTRKPPRTTLFPYTALFRSRGLDLSNVVLADAAGQVVGDEDIGFERVTVPPELQYDADTLLNMVEDCLNGVAADGVLGQEAEAPEALQTAGQRRERRAVNGRMGKQVLDILGGRPQQPLDPVLALAAAQRISRVEHRIGEVHRLAQRAEVLGLDVAVGQRDDVIGADATPLGGLVVKREDADLVREELFEALVTAAILVKDLPAVVVVHVKDEV